MVLALCTLSNVTYMKFRKHSLNGFQVIEQTRFCDGHSSKEDYSKTINARVMVHALCTSSNVGLYSYEVL